MLAGIIFISVGICVALSQFLAGALFYFGVALVEVATLAVVYSKVDKCWQRTAIKYILSVSLVVYLFWGIVDTSVYYAVIGGVIGQEFRPIYERFEDFLIVTTALITAAELFVSLTRGANGLVRPDSNSWLGSNGSVHHSSLHRNEENR